jgi:hypothetical protein
LLLNITTFFQLNADSCSESEVKEDDDKGPSETLSASEIQKKKKKRKNKKKHKAGNHIPPKSSGDNLEDEVERSVREVNRLLGEAPKSSVNSADPIKFPSARSLLGRLGKSTLYTNSYLLLQ